MRGERGVGDRRHGAGGDAAPGGPVKYLLVLVCIIGAITYIFVAGPKAITGQGADGTDRSQAVWEHIGQLEARRQDRLIRAKGRSLAMLPPQQAARGGPWAAGYREGFARGYYVGNAAAVSRQPNPGFFPFSP